MLRELRIENIAVIERAELTFQPGLSVLSGETGAGKSIIIDALNAIAGERVFGFCLDTGHLLLTGQDPQNAVALLGDRLEALHIHDNNGQEDQHLAPYMGVLDWDRFVAGLRDAGYRKPLSFETFNVIRRFDPALAPYALRLIAETGKMFARRLEGEA